MLSPGGIGALKKEIVFTGDALNSTARIQSLCNDYEVDILISDELLKCLSIDSNYQVQSLWKNQLKGKANELELYTIK